MTPTEWIAEQTRRINLLEAWSAERDYPGDREVLAAELAETRRIRDDFVEFAKHTYATGGDQS